MVKAQDGAGRAGGRCGLRDAENKTNGNSGSESFQPRCQRGTAARLPPDGATPAPPEPSIPAVSIASGSRAAWVCPVRPEPSRGKLTYSSWVGRL